MNQFLEKSKAALPDVIIKQQEPLAFYTSFRCGGVASFFCQIDSVEHLVTLVTLAGKEGVPVRVLGSGTNALVPKGGFFGLVIKNNCRRFELRGMKGKFIDNKIQLSNGLLYAEAGAITNQVVRFVVDQGFGGLEFALGLPGTIGGAVCVNANFPKENKRIGESVYAAKILTASGEILDVDKSYFGFRFDASRLLKDHAILLSVLFTLHPVDKKIVWEKANEAVSYRTSTMPKNIATGMTFRNITMQQIVPNSSLPKDISPFYLLEKAGLLGYTVGRVSLGKDNPNYIINNGEATEVDVINLLSIVKETVFRKFGVQLEMNAYVVQ